MRSTYPPPAPAQGRAQAAVAKLNTATGKLLALLAMLALQGFAQTTVITVDSSGDLSAVGNVQGSSLISEAGVAGGTYGSGITTTGAPPQTCMIQFTNGGGTGATASVELTGTNTIAVNSPLMIVSPGQGYTSAPTTASYLAGGTATCSGIPSSP